MRVPADQGSSLAVDIAVCQAHDTVTISIDGELDHQNARALREVLATINMTRVVLDLRGLTFMDAGGINAIVGAHRRLRDDGRVVSLLAPTRGGVAKVLEITGIVALLEVDTEVTRHVIHCLDIDAFTSN